MKTGTPITTTWKRFTQIPVFLHYFKIRSLCWTDR